MVGGKPDKEGAAMHRSGRMILLACVLFSIAATSAAVQPPTSIPTPDGLSKSTASLPGPDAQIERIILAMNSASTWGHPDLFGEFAGMRFYSEGHYKTAIRYFEYGARFADKLSQLSVGLMYDNGRGVEKDPVKACAWLALASERKYPSFIATRDRVCKALTPVQQDEATAVLDKLLPVYGDKVAKHRMALALNLAKMDMTGSRLGFNSGVSMYVGPWPPSGPGSFAGEEEGPRLASFCAAPTLYIGGMPVPKAGCGSIHFYSPLLWNPKQYFAARDARWRGTVTVGSLQDVDKPAPKASAQKSGSAPPASSAGH
ncbi:MAG TPA: sel1 repeat family protein [Rhodanobacteraceae bacterium]|nr:sel1 repeat family protein [Rhodanobacteraceae bacterium]